jgi:hypothetical protein
MGNKIMKLGKQVKVMGRNEIIELLYPSVIGLINDSVWNFSYNSVWRSVSNPIEKLEN